VLNQARDVFMTWCLIKQEVRPHGVVPNEARGVFMTWCLIKQEMSSWHGA